MSTIKTFFKTWETPSMHLAINCLYITVKDNGCAKQEEIKHCKNAIYYICIRDNLHKTNNNH